MTDSPRPKPFRVSVTEDDQRDLQKRLQRARLPDQQEGVAWEQGTSKVYLQVTQTSPLEQVWDSGRSVVSSLSGLKKLVSMQDLLAYWRSGYNWPKQEAWLNSHFRHFKLRVGEIDLHYVHHPSDDPHAIPLLMVHGWPGSFMDYHKLIPKLQQKGGQRILPYLQQVAYCEDCGANTSCTSSLSLSHANQTSTLANYLCWRSSTFCMHAYADEFSRQHTS